MVIKRLTGLLPGSKRQNSDSNDAPQEKDTPEANVVRGVKLFCESAAANSGEEVLHLPTIVESAVASPQAASAGANQIRQFLKSSNGARPHIQYNAIMLIRILADNPGQSFTKNFDHKFVDTVKQLLRSGRDPSVQQILRETLDSLNRDKAYDTNLNLLFAMWRKEQNVPPPNPGYSVGTVVQPNGNGPAAGSRRRSERGLPSPAELSARVEEARTSAKLLLQLVQSTPPNEVFTNDLIKEFAERCQVAHKSVQGYINCENPAPDDDTMLTLIETNEQLSLAASKHQRAILAARKALGMSPTPTPPANMSREVSYMSPPAQSISPPPPAQQPASSALPQIPTTAPLSMNPSQNPSIPPTLQAAPQRKPTYPPPSSQQPERVAPHPAPAEDPFSDDQAYAPPAGPPPSNRQAPRRTVDDDDDGVPMDFTEPYHPGYQTTNQPDSGYGPGAGTVSSMGDAGSPRSRGVGEDVSPVETRTTAAGGMTYRY